jgi:hypothetical protein
MPEAPEGRFAHVDVAGVVVLAAALLLVLFLAGERNLWSRHLAVAAGLGQQAPGLLHPYRLAGDPGGLGGLPDSQSWWRHTRTSSLPFLTLPRGPGSSAANVRDGTR